MKLSHRQMKRIAGPLSFGLKLLMRSWRTRRLGFPCTGCGPEYIEAICHGDMLPCIGIHLVDFRGIVAMISTHRDGQLIAEVLHRFGGFVARGSSTRGGARVYLEMLKKYRGDGWAVTPDGPRGPRGGVQEGVIKLASDSGRAIRPRGYAAASAKHLRSWDRFVIPLPFTRVVEFVGDPLHVPPKVDKATRAELAKDLERRLADATRQAELGLQRWLRRHPEPVPDEERDATTRG